MQLAEGLSAHCNPPELRFRGTISPNPKELRHDISRTEKAHSRGTPGVRTASAGVCRSLSSGDGQSRCFDQPAGNACQCRRTGKAQTQDLISFCFPARSGLQPGRAASFHFDDHGAHAAACLSFFSSYCPSLREPASAHFEFGMFRSRNANLFDANRRCRFSLSMKSKGPHMRRRTSYVLFNRASLRMPGCTTRLPGGVASVDLHQRGKRPPVGCPPQRRGDEVAA